jgi:hypothetical protein
MKYKVDERVGCIAIIRNISPLSNGLHSDDFHVVQYWHGYNMENKLFGQEHICWHVPGRLRKRAYRLCARKNNVYGNARKQDELQKMV